MESPMKNYTISNLNEEEVESIPIQWARKEGWNPASDDVKAFYAQDPHGFFAGRLNDEPIGCCSAVVYGDTFAFFGFYIVKKEFRHMGYGIQMTRHRLQYVGDRNIGLDGVINMTDKYARIGFRPAHINIRYQVQNLSQVKRDPHISLISQSLIPKIERYDRLYFPASRPAFLKEWLKQTSNRISLAYIDEGVIKGYGTIRHCFNGYKIGPLFADSFDVAEKIFQSLASEANGDIIFLDIPEPNLLALKLVEKYKMIECFKTLRMYTKEIPDINLDHIFGITTFELG